MHKFESKSVSLHILAPPSRPHEIYWDGEHSSYIFRVAINTKHVKKATKQDV